MSGNDPGLLVVPGGVAGKLEDLSGQVLHDGGEVDGGSGTHPLCVVALAEHPVDAAHRELEAGTGRAGLRLGLQCVWEELMHQLSWKFFFCGAYLDLATFAATRHLDEGELEGN